SFKSSAFRLYVHDVTTHGGIPHGLDVSFNGTPEVWTDDANNTTDLTIECSDFRMGRTFYAGMFKFSAGRRLVFPANVLTGCGSHTMMAFGPHGPDGNTYGWDGAEIYRNIFDCSNDGGGEIVGNGLGSHIRIYNNLFRQNRSGDARAAIYTTSCG